MHPRAGLAFVLGPAVGLNPEQTRMLAFAVNGEHPALGPVQGPPAMRALDVLDTFLWLSEGRPPSVTRTAETLALLRSHADRALDADMVETLIGLTADRVRSHPALNR
jgi:hypothetical protein